MTQFATGLVCTRWKYALYWANFYARREGCRYWVRYSRQTQMWHYGPIPVR